MTFSENEQAMYLAGEYRRYYDAKSTKRDLMDVAAEMFEPDDEILSGNKNLQRTSGLTEHEDRILLDTTCLKIIKDYVHNVLGLAFFQQSRWFRIEHSDFEDGSEEQKVLHRRADVLYKNIARTNYYQQIIPLEFDVVGYGHGCFVIDQDDDTFAKCYSKNPYDVVFATDIYGEVITTMWEQSYDSQTLLDQFPSLKSVVADRKNAGSEIEDAFVVQVSFFELHDSRRLTAEDKKKKKAGYKYVMKYCLKDAVIGEGVNQTKTEIYDTIESDYFKSKPVFPVRDMITRSHPYGKGIYRDLIPKARILNSIAYGSLQFIAQQYNPAMLMDPDVYQKAGGEIKAGQVFLKKTEGFSNPNQNPVVRLDSTGDLNAIMAVYQQQQAEVADTLPTAGNIYKTSRQSVEEIHQRMNDEEKKLAPLRSVYAKEAVNQHVRRFYSIAEKKGLFKNLPLPDGIKADISADSKKLIFDGFLLQKYRQGQVAKILQAINSASGLGSVSPHSLGFLNGDKIIKTIFDNFGVFQMLKSDEQVTAERERTVSQQQQQQDLEEKKVNIDSSVGLAKISEALAGGGQ